LVDLRFLSPPPAPRADPVTYDSARGHITVTSQHKDLPLCHAMYPKGASQPTYTDSRN